MKNILIVVAVCFVFLDVNLFAQEETQVEMQGSDEQYIVVPYNDFTLIDKNQKIVYRFSSGIRGHDVVDLEELEDKVLEKRNERKQKR